MTIFLSFLIFEVIYFTGIKGDINDNARKFIDDNYIIMNPDTFINSFNSSRSYLDESECYDILYYIKKILQRYIYLDILKNPPQSESYYHTKVDLFGTIPNCSSNYYNFYRSIKEWLSQAEDEHLNFCLNKGRGSNEMFPLFKKIALQESFAISPLKFHISKKGEVFAIPSKFITYFDEKIQKVIKDNENKSIYNINNIDPINYISSFNDNLHNMKSKQAQFVRNQYIIELFDFDDYPIKKERLKEIKIIYSNNQSVIYDYLVLCPRMKTTILFGDFKRIIYNNLETKEVKWDESASSGQLKCKVDKINHVNVIYQNSFSFEKEGKEEGWIIATKIIDKCFEKFDKNNFPIVVIEDFNKGGLLSVANYLTEYLNLNKPNYLYSALKINNDYENSIKHFIGDIKNYNTCKFENNQKIYNNPQTIDYENDSNGKKIVHEISGLYDNSIINNTNIYKFRPKAKNIRKPNEIIIFTDGYSFSAASYLIKGTQLRKGAIIVGYGGNPKLKKFDASQSPTAVKHTYQKGDFYEKRLEEFGFSFSYAYEESFKYYKDIKYPLEFEIMNIDERVELYNKYDDSRYQEFIDEAKKIFEKYNEINCNPNNKNILLLSEKCIFSDNFTHGGFECGEDGKWSDKCIPSYCDMGYYFDIIKKKCVVDPCFAVYDEEIKKEKLEWKKKIIKILILIIIILFAVLVLVFVYNKKICKNVKKCISKINSYNNYSPIELNDL